MKTLKTIPSFLLAFAIWASSAQAAKMDSETQNQVIDRLERVLSQMERTESSWMSTNLRLADLLAERARQRFMNEIEENCKGCKGSTQDRKRAISLYENVLPKASKDEQGVILFQLGHLYETAGQDKKSIALFEKIIKNAKTNPPSLVTRARLGLGDIHFQKGEFKKALFQYNIALTDKDAPSRGLVTYRAAWSEFNLGRIDAATKSLEKLLGSPDLLTKDTESGTVYDAAFHGDVARDLATFYARRPITQARIDRYKELAPADQQKEFLLFFADEADRLGQKQAAYDIYQSYLAEPKLTKEERLSAFVRLAQIKYDMGQSAKSTEDFALAAMTFKETKCSDAEKCADLQKRMKRYVTELHRSKKVKPDLDVLKAYFIYTQTFPEDSQMAVLGAQLAMDLKQFGMAASMYRQASETEDAKLQTIALDGEMDAAERTGDLNARESAYRHYLAKRPNGPKSFLVRYQLAQVAYERKQWSQAANEFSALALDKSGPADLRKKSADLALDALAIEKRDADIEKSAEQFAAAMPAHAQEFRQLERKALINQVAKTANDQDSSKSELRSALRKMSATNLKGASDAEKILHYRNQSVLASKAGEDALFIAALNGMLAVKSLSAQDREAALAQKVGYYEKVLDFKSAYNVAVKMRFPSLGTAERELRLGTLSDLAGRNPRRHYEAALRAGLRGPRAVALHARLVNLSANPKRELKMRASELSRDPVTFSDVILMVYGKTRDANAVDPYLRSNAMARSEAARFIRKQSFYPASQRLAQRLERLRLTPQSDRLLQKSIQSRMAALAEADRSLAQAVRLNDYTAQVIALTTVSRENERFVRELLGLPLPRKLTAAQQKQYTDLLKQQAKPFYAKAKVAAQKLDEFWGNDRAFDNLIKDYENSRPGLRGILAQELRLLSKYASGSSKSRLESALRSGAPSSADLLAAREAVRSNPDNTRDLEKLKIMETKIGHPLMSSYLEQRLEQIQRKEI
ncbi:MAG: hypothetical protein KF802_12300 [Bdellovibrionaceae bacterium]|nr:hypothetical protein [Pseudobdellovibrionaceae bacterium]